MLILSNGIRILLDHVAWYSLRYQKAEVTSPGQKDKWVLQFGYAGGEKTFVAYYDQAEASDALDRADRAMKEWLNQ
jgi:hypothetical protein